MQNKKFMLKELKGTSIYYPVSFSFTEYIWKRLIFEIVCNIAK
jgi:hypothetical protein